MFVFIAMARRGRNKCGLLWISTSALALGLFGFLVIVLDLSVSKQKNVCVNIKSNIDIDYGDYLELPGFENSDHDNKSTRNDSTDIKYKVRHPVEKELKSRYQNYQTACKGKEFFLGSIKERAIGQRFQVCPRRKLIYCGIEKAGTTFWRRLLQVLDADILSSPFTIHPKDVNKRNKELVRGDFFEMLARFQTNTVFTFVRNPFTRLLSGYLDKIYSANPYYWQLLGAEMTNWQLRPYGCYSNITFPQFIDYIIQAEYRHNRRRDVHFMQMHDLCKPCQVNYDFIGRIETLQRDLFYLLERLNMTKYKSVLENIADESIEDTFLDIATALEERRNDIKKCMPMYEAYMRSWRSVQIRGLISIDIEFPFTKQQSENLSSKGFRKALREAHIKSKSTTDLRSQKSSLFQKAYRNIPLETMHKLSSVLKLDFEIFGYEPYPKTLFERENHLTTDSIFNLHKI